jgi:hypothetical protein
MEQLRDAGRLVIPITGRPAGWCDHIARMAGGCGRRRKRRLHASRRRRTAALPAFADDGGAAPRTAAAIGEQIVAAVPGARLRRALSRIRSCHRLLRGRHALPRWRSTGSSR